MRDFAQWNDYDVSLDRPHEQPWRIREFEESITDALLTSSSAQERWTSAELDTAVEGDEVVNEK